MCQKKLDTMRNAGVKVNGIWAQDWSGIRMTSFGKRVMWNWKWNSENYPQLDSRIKQWNKEGVQFLAYINPYVASDKDLCEEAAKRGYLAKMPPAAIIWWSLASSTAALSISLIRKPTHGSRK